MVAPEVESSEMPRAESSDLRTPFQVRETVTASRVSIPPPRLALSRPTPPAPPPPSPGNASSEPNPSARRRRWILGGAAIVYAGLATFSIVQQAQPRSWDPAVADYVAFVEAERGLEFDHPVDVRWADIAEELAQDFALERQRSAEGEPSYDPYEEAYGLLGLIDSNADRDLAQSIDETATENARAFYESSTETIVLPVGESQEALGFTIVHELTHALQHQHGMLQWHLESPDSAATRTSLIEGDAERIAVAWFDRLSELAQQRHLDAIGYSPDESFDDPGDAFLEGTFFASYSLGLPVVQAIVEVDGVDEINRLLLADEVGTSERLVDVLSPDDASSVDAFTRLTLPDGADFADGDLGAVTWFRALAPMVGTGRALDAVLGYDDDAFVIVKRGSQRCGRFIVLFDSGADATEFVEILSLVAEPGSLQTVGSSVEFDLCEPIGDSTNQLLGTLMPLVVANEMSLTHLRNGVESETARCAALAQAATVPADVPLDSFDGWQSIEEGSFEFLQNC